MSLEAELRAINGTLSRVAAALEALVGLAQSVSKAESVNGAKAKSSPEAAVKPVPVEKAPEPPQPEVAPEEDDDDDFLLDKPAEITEDDVRTALKNLQKKTSQAQARKFFNALGYKVISDVPADKRAQVHAAVTAELAKVPG